MTKRPHARGSLFLILCATLAALAALPGAHAADPEAPMLTPGPGWTGPTPQPDPIGTGFGADAKAIARWDVVPYQTIDCCFEVGVVAFHINGIDRVEFSADNGPWVAVREMTLNPRTQVVEYWAVVDGNAFPDGPIEIRAIAYPKVGIPRVLAGENVIIENGEHSMFLFGNAGGSFKGSRLYVSLSGSDEAGTGAQDKPYRTISRAIDVCQDGAEIVLLDAGIYEGPSRSNGKLNTRWITIRPSSSVPARNAIVSRTAWSLIRPKVNRLRWKDVVFDLDMVQQYYSESNYAVCFERCHWYDSQGWISKPDRMINVRGPYYALNCSAKDTLYAFAGAILIRNCECERISGDAFQNSSTVLNVTARIVGATDIDHHSDLYQMWNSRDNIIVYGMNATELATQSIFLQPTILSSPDARSALKNSAFVNLNMVNLPTFANGQNTGGPPFSQMQSAFDHILFQDVKLPQQRFFFRTDYVWPSHAQGWEAKNVVFRHVGFHPTSWDNYCNPSARDFKVVPGVTFEACYALSTTN